MNDFQFYPTPKELASKAWALFKNKSVSRLLEPSAGKGDLLHDYLREGGRSNWDAIELNPELHPILKEKGAKIVGYDFLEHTNCAIYSHILMNPPFMQGAAHVLHAWSTLYDGEIVAILNAETIKNPFSKEREFLVKLIEQYGTVEFIQEAFLDEEAERKTAVEVALVYLQKKADKSTIITDVLSALDKEEPAQNHANWTPPQELAIPENFVTLNVRVFNMAVEAAKDAATASARAKFYANRLGMTMEQLHAADKMDVPATKAETYASMSRDLFAESYAELKNSAWATVVRSLEVLSKLSSKAQKRLELEFETIKALEFTEKNVYGFLCGLTESSGKISDEMTCDVFDEITRYHEDNTVYFMGWVSNSKHRTAGMRIKCSRFILPGHMARSYDNTASFETVRFLTDFDKVFSMLDGKPSPVKPLAALFDSPETYTRLKNGERLSSDYFDVRLYGKKGTIHFFPRSKELIDKLNTRIGRLRQWLPPQWDHAPKDFKRQFDEAESLNAEVLANMAKNPSTCRLATWDIANAFRSKEEGAIILNKLAGAVEAVLSSKGIHPFDEVGHDKVPVQLLLAA